MAERLTNHARCAGAQLEAREGGLHVPSDLGHQAAVGRQLVIEAQKALGFRLVLEGVEKHRLSDSPQPADDHALVRRPPLQAPDEYAELLELGCTAGELGRARSGIGRVRIGDGIRGLPSYTKLSRNVISE